MKHVLIIFCAVLGFGLVSHGQQPSEMDPGDGVVEMTLSDYMKMMGAEFGPMVRLSRTGPFTSDQLDSVENLQDIILKASLMAPAMAKTPAEQLSYSKVMIELAMAALELESAVETAIETQAIADDGTGRVVQDLSEIGVVLRRMRELQGFGHSEFRPRR